MKKLLLGLLALVASSYSYADTKVSALTADTTAQSTDLFYKVDNPGGTPSSRSISLTNLESQFTLPAANLSGQIPSANLSNAVLNQNTLQSGSTFYVSHGTLLGTTDDVNNGLNVLTVSGPYGTQTNYPLLKIANTSSFANNNAVLFSLTSKNSLGLDASIGQFKGINTDANTSTFSGDFIFSVFSSGNLRDSFRISGISGANSFPLTSIGVPTGTIGAKLHINPQSPFVIGEIIQSTTSQTADLQEWQNSSGVAIASVTASGVFTGNGSGLTNLNFGNVSGSTTSVTMIFDGGGSAIVGGSTSTVQIPFTCTISSWTVLAPRESGSITVGVKKATYANFPTFTDMVGAGNTPSLSSAQKNTAAPASWTSTSFSAGDTVSFVPSSITSATWVAVTLWLIRT